MKNTIELNINDSALIITDNLEVQLVLPKHLYEQETVAENIMLISAISLLLQRNDETFRNLLMQTIKTITEEANLFEEETKEVIH
jgi:hypothetical protein